MGATSAEAVLVVALAALLLWRLSRGDPPLTLLGLMSAGLLLIHLPHILLFFRLLFGWV